MTNTKLNNYKKALVEVEAALNCLNYDDYKKIPDELIENIEINKDENYIYDYDDNLEYENWNFMKETRAILYNIFKKYLATDEQRKYLNQKEMYEIKIIEEEKKKLYNVDNIFNKSDIKKDNINDMKLIEYKESFIKSILKKISVFFKKKRN